MCAEKLWQNAQNKCEKFHTFENRKKKLLGKNREKVGDSFGVNRWFVR
jgi:hypothetical protein